MRKICLNLDILLLNFHHALHRAFIREGELPTLLARAAVHAPGTRFFLGRRAVRGAFVSSQATVTCPE